MKVDTSTGHATQLTEVMHKLIMGLAIVCIVTIPPFAIYHFIQGRLFLGIVLVAIVAIFILNALSLLKNNRYYPSLILFGLVPSVIWFLILSARNQGIVGVLWCYPVILSFYFMLPQRKAWIANGALLMVMLPFIGRFFELGLAIRISVTLLMISTFSAIFVSLIAKQQQKLQLQAVTDSLTGALNRTTLHETLKQAMYHNHRTSVPMTLLAFDLDHFKEINDTYGHNVGDAVLQDFTELLLHRCRKTDKVFRLGGEEFLVFLYNTNLKNGRRFAEELRTRVESLQTIPERTITVSIGLSTLESSETWREWMKRSDDNLYQAKLNGRNRVVA